MEDFLHSIHNTTVNLNNNKPQNKQMPYVIQRLMEYTTKAVSVIDDLDCVLLKHPVYLPGSIARLALKPCMEKKAVYSQYAALRWSQDQKVAEINFLVGLLSLLTGPRASWFQASSLKISCPVVLTEAFKCIVDYEEDYGPDIKSNFFHQCLLHFKTVKSEDFHNTP